MARLLPRRLFFPPTVHAQCTRHRELVRDSGGSRCGKSGHDGRSSLAIDIAPFNQEINVWDTGKH